MRPIRTFTLALLALALAHGTPARAQTPPAGLSIDEAALRAYVSRQVTAVGAPVTRLEVQFGNLDRLALAPCRRSEPFLSAGARLWGRSSLGVRCVDGASWNVLVPITVRIWGQTVVAAAPLAAGTVLGTGDLQDEEIELTREPPGLVRDMGQLQGRTLTRALAQGQPLRADAVRPTTVIHAGDLVRLRIGGPGFSVLASGEALGAAADGQPLRVRSELGRILTGIARQGRVVDVGL